VVVGENIAGKNRQNGLHVKVFTPVKKFKKAHAVGGTVSPWASVTGPLFEIADGVFSGKALIKSIAFEIVSARKRRKEGACRRSICMRSMRLPLGRLLNVGGNRETRLSHRVPLAAEEITKRALAVGSTLEVVRVRSYFFHWPLISGTAPAA